MNDNNDPQGGNEVLEEEEDESMPKPFLDKPTATIYFDGLIYSAFNKAKRLYQTAVLTQAEEHHLKVEVRLRGEEKLLFPTEEHPWNPDHGVIKGLAPFWMYVDSGNGLNPEEFSSSLHSPEEKVDEQSFAHVFNFNERHGRPLVPRPKTFAEFNFPHGTGYSALNKKADLKVLAPNQPISEAEDKGEVKVSTLIGLDIDAASDGENRKYIVLANQAGQEYFRFELEPEKHYEIQILNQPIPQHHAPEPPAHPHPEPHPGHGAHGGNGGHVHIDHAKHFLQFYELFGLNERNERFIVDLGPLPPNLPHSPPCVGTGGDKVGGLGGS